MTDANWMSFRRLRGSVLVFGALAAAAATNQGCSSGKESATTTMSTGSHMATGSTGSTGSGGSGGSGGSSACSNGPFQGNIVPGANGGFTDAFDATPNADGSAVYFTATTTEDDSTLRTVGVFKQTLCPTAGAITPVYTNSVLTVGAFEAPFGIAVSSDDMTLYVSDLSAEEDPADTSGAKDKGVLFKLSAAGGAAPAVLVGSIAARGVTVAQEGGTDVIYFTGFDKATGMPGVFKVAPSGGAVTTIASGSPFSDPSGVTVASNGDLYVVDTSADDTGIGRILIVKAGAASEFVPNLQVGYPAGIAIRKDDSELMVSGLNAGAFSDIIFQVTVASKAVMNNTNGNISSYGESAGLHRAHKADVFAWADSKAKPMGLMGTGTVFVIK